MNAQIKDLIISSRIKKRPLADKSINAYVSTLSNLYGKVFDKDFDPNDFNDYHKFLEYLNDVEFSKRKTILASLLAVATDETAIDEYRKLMLKDSKKYDEEMEKNEMTEKYRDSWITPQEIDELGTVLREDWTKLYKKHLSGHILTNKDKQQMQEYIIYLLTCGRYGLPPRRLLDWTEMKIESYDARNKTGKLDYNIFEPQKKQFIFNRFKTDESFKRQIIKTPPYIEQYLKLWRGVKPESPYLLSDTKAQKLSPITLNQRMNKIYGEGKSVNSLRHSYITDRYKHVPSVRDMKETAVKMGHSIRSAMAYIKR